jgi:hypothetical protein
VDIPGRSIILVYGHGFSDKKIDPGSGKGLALQNFESRMQIAWLHYITLWERTTYRKSLGSVEEGVYNAHRLSLAGSLLVRLSFQATQFPSKNSKNTYPIHLILFLSALARAAPSRKIFQVPYPEFSLILVRIVRLRCGVLRSRNGASWTV